jgi:hypothetical protein
MRLLYKTSELSKILLIDTTYNILVYRIELNIDVDSSTNLYLDRFKYEVVYLYITFWRSKC